MRRSGLTVVETLAGVALVSVAAVLALPAVAQARDASARAACAANIRQIGVGLSLFSREHEGRLPAMSTDANGGWSGFFDPADICPEYLSRLDALTCTEQRTSEARSYVYTGWESPQGLFSSQALEALRWNVDARDEVLRETPAAAEEDWRLDPSVEGREVFHRLTDGLARYQVTDICNEATAAQSRAETAILWERFAAPVNETPVAGAPAGANVLFMDGHVEFRGWNGGAGRFPSNAIGQMLAAPR